MKKTLRAVLIALALTIAGIQQSFASGGIAVKLLGITLDSTLTVPLGYNLTVSALVTNTDSFLSFTGILDFGLRDTSQTLSSTNVFSKPPYSGDTLLLGPGESVPAIFGIGINTPYFAPGPDVVVVWPISFRGIADSIRIPLIIVDPSDIKDAGKEEIKYILTDTKIILQNPPADNRFEQVRLFDLLGRPVASVKSVNISEIPIPDLPRGIYLCEIMAADGSRKVFRFFH